MKNKILIFVFTILTFGLFLVPLSFAKKYVIKDLDMVNRVKNIRYESTWNAFVYIDVDTTSIKGNGDYFVSLMMYDINGNNISVNDSSLGFFFGGTNNSNYSVHYSSVNNCHYLHSTASTINNDFYIYFGFSTDTINKLKNYEYTFNVFVYRSTSSSADYMYSNYFIPNDFYGLSTGAYGVFANTQVMLRYSGSSSSTDITSDVMYFNTIKLNEYYVNLINNTNNVSSGNNYYLRVYFRDYVKYLTNFNLSYTELMQMSNGTSTYSDLTSIRNALPIISNNIVLYNNNTQLFTTNDLVNSGYGDYYIEYIDFRLADYSFKSSQYYNSSIGINGYLSGFTISALNFNNQDVYYNGYNEGQRVGYDSGYNNGFNDGVASNKTSFDGLMLSVANVPMTIISSMLNFEIFGVNLLSFFMGIITLVLFVHLMRKFKE